jgi:hypothetical protein
MNGRDDEKFRELLRSAIAPAADLELKRDLWPKMLRKLDERAPRVSWLDWALVALLAMWFLFSPEAIPLLLYHL